VEITGDDARTRAIGACGGHEERVITG